MNDANDMIQKIRSEWSASDCKRDEGLTTPSDVKRYDNIQYGKDSVWQSLDVYQPLGNREVKGVIVNVHGGGWVYGTKEVYQYYCMSLCQRAFVVVNFNYRLAPEHPFPAALEDTESVFDWVQKNAAYYGAGGNIFAVGDSAGAHILSLYAATHKDNRLKAIALNCGAYHGPMGDLLPIVCPNGSGKSKMNVLPKIQKDFPPAFCMTATGDILKDECVSLFRRLVLVGVPCAFHLYGTAECRLPHVFHVDIKRKEAAICNDDTAAWFTRYME